MATSKVTLMSEEHGINPTIKCNDDVFVLDVAEALTYLIHVVLVLVLRVLVK